MYLQRWRFFFSSVTLVVENLIILRCGVLVGFVGFECWIFTLHVHVKTVLLYCPKLNQLCLSTAVVSTLSTVFVSYLTA